MARLRLCCTLSLSAVHRLHRGRRCGPEACTAAHLAPWCGPKARTLHLGAGRRPAPEVQGALRCAHRVRTFTSGARGTPAPRCKVRAPSVVWISMRARPGATPLDLHQQLALTRCSSGVASSFFCCLSPRHVYLSRKICRSFPLFHSLTTPLAARWVLRGQPAAPWTDPQPKLMHEHPLTSSV